jgi:hypothetical protein
MTPVDFQVTVDAARPHELADWWAAVLGWEVEPSDEAFIRRMIAEGYATESDTMVHNGSLVWSEGAAIRHPAGPDSGRPRVLFQFVPEAKSVKNRMHLDLRADPGESAAMVACSPPPAPPNCTAPPRVRTSGSPWPIPRATSSASANPDAR